MKRIELRIAVRSLLELLAVTGLAVAQPILDVFGKAPEAFVAHDASTIDIVLFALVVTFVPALVLWAVEMLVRALDAEAGRILHVMLLAALVGLFAIQVLKDLHITAGVILLLLGVAAAGLAAAAYRWKGVRSWLAVLAIGPAVFLASFLWMSPSSDLLRSNDVGAAEVHQTGEARSVVMIVWDEWPLNSIVNADAEIDADLFPNLAALAEDGAWYRNATTVATATTAAVPAILSGRYAHDGASPTAADHPENLFTLLASQYDLEVSESVTAMCPDSLCSDPFIDDPSASAEAEAAAEEEASATESNPLSRLMDDALASYRAMISLDPDAAGPQSVTEDVTAVTDTTAPATDPDAVEAAVDEARTQQGGAGGFPALQIDSFESLVSSIEEGEDPALHFLHIQLPHTPYRFLPDGRTYAEAGFGPGIGGDIVGSRGPEAADAVADRQQLLLQVGYVDRLVGQVVVRLKEAGLYDDTMIVMTSDHGTGFVPGESHRGLDDSDHLAGALYPDILYVPLIVKAPGLEPGTVSDDNVMSIDILPTIADVLGIDVPWSLDGQSLLGPARTTSEKQFNKVKMDGGPGGFGGGPGGFGGGVSLAPTQSFDGDEVLPQNLDRNIDTLLIGHNTEHRLFAITRDGDLVGTDTANLEQAPAAGGTLLVDGGLDALEAYTSDDVVVPVHLTGSVDGGPSGDLTVAFAVDGVIAAVVPTFPDGDQPHYFDAILDPSTLTGPAPHHVRALLITGQGDSRGATPLST